MVVSVAPKVNFGFYFTFTKFTAKHTSTMFFAGNWIRIQHEHKGECTHVNEGQRSWLQHLDGVGELSSRNFFQKTQICTPIRGGKNQSSREHRRAQAPHDEQKKWFDKRWTRLCTYTKKIHENRLVCVCVRMWEAHKRVNDAALQYHYWQTSIRRRTSYDEKLRSTAPARQRLADSLCECVCVCMCVAESVRSVCIRPPDGRK